MIIFYKTHCADSTKYNEEKKNIKKRDDSVLNKKDFLLFIIRDIIHVGIYLLSMIFLLSFSKSLFEKNITDFILSIKEVEHIRVFIFYGVLYLVYYNLVKKQIVKNEKLKNLEKIINIFFWPIEQIFFILELPGNISKVLQNLTKMNYQNDIRNPYNVENPMYAVYNLRDTMDNFVNKADSTIGNHISNLNDFISRIFIIILFIVGIFYLGYSLFFDEENNAVKAFFIKNLHIYSQKRNKN